VIDVSLFLVILIYLWSV